MFFQHSGLQRSGFNDFVSHFQQETKLPFKLTGDAVINFDARAYIRSGGFEKIDSTYYPFIRFNLDTSFQNPYRQLGVYQVNYYKRILLSPKYISLIYYIEHSTEGNNSYFSFILSNYSFDGKIISSLPIGHFHNSINFNDESLSSLDYSKYDSLFSEANEVLKHSLYYIDATYIVSCIINSESQILVLTEEFKELRYGEQDGLTISMDWSTQKYIISDKGVFFIKKD